MFEKTLGSGGDQGKLEGHVLFKGSSWHSFSLLLSCVNIGPVLPDFSSFQENPEAWIC